MQGIENGGRLLMVDSVTKRYKLPSGYEVETLGGISLELRKGEMLGLFGPNEGGEDHACKHHYWPYLALHNWGCSWGLNPPVSRRQRVM